MQVYHPRNEPPYNEDSLNNGLWVEGLATYVSYALNPDASNTELLLDFPKNLIVDVQEGFQTIIKDIQKSIYSTDPKIYKKYFLLNKDSIVPQRSGYYIGFLLIKEIAKSFSLNQLVLLDEHVFVPEF